MFSIEQPHVVIKPNTKTDLFNFQRSTSQGWRNSI